LSNDEWASERGNFSTAKGKARDRAFEVLKDTIARHGKVPTANENIPPATPCISETHWRAAGEPGCISEGFADATRMAFKRAAAKLIKDGMVGKWTDWVWAIR